MYLPSSYAFDAANEMLSHDDFDLVYDDNGNLVSKTDRVTLEETTYDWDARNRLVGISGPSVTASFTYDALNRRIEKTVNGVTTTYVYDGWDIIQESVIGGPTTNYTRTLNIDEPLAFERTDGTIRYYVQDALGSVIALTDAEGLVTTTYNYDAFGAVTINGTDDQPFQYTGRENDGTGLYYYRARYYSPEMRRFISEDPIGLAGGINFFVYVWDNPMNYTDPYGLKPNLCLQDWAECYTRCIDALDPFGNLAERLANSVITKRILDKIGQYLPTKVARIIWRNRQLQASTLRSLLAAWQAGTSYGCMISCAMDTSNY